MTTLNALSQGYSCRRDVPVPAVANAIDKTLSFAFLLKQALLNAEAGGLMSSYARPAASICTVVNSSKGDGAAPSASDLWGATYDATKLVQAASGTNHSWIVVQNATHQFCIDLCVAGGYLRFATTPIAHPFTGGTATQGPTALGYEWNMGTHAQGNTSYFNLITDTTYGGTEYFHFVAGDDGQFFALMNRVSGGGFHVCLWHAKSHDAVANVDNWWNAYHSVNTPAGPSNRGAPGGAQSVGWMYQQAYAARLFDGTLPSYLGLGPFPSYGGLAMPAVLTTTTDARTGKYMVWDLEMLNASPAPIYSLGFVADVNIITTVPVFTPIPSAAAIERIVAGDFVIPWAGGVPSY